MIFQIGTFLYRKLGRSGLVLYLQTFQYKRWNNPNIQESGVNIVGILPGHHWETSIDKPLIISTYWDIEVDDMAINYYTLYVMFDYVDIFVG